MRFAIVFAAVLGVAVAASKVAEFIDDELSVAYQLSDALYDTAIKSYRDLIDGVDQLASGVPITIESATNGGIYSLESLYDGTLDLQNHVTNGVQGVALSLNATLVGKQSLIERAMTLIGPVIGQMVYANTMKDYVPWTHLLCFWQSEIRQFRLSINDMTAALNGLSCDNLDGPPDVKKLQTSNGTFISTVYLNYYACSFLTTLAVPGSLFDTIRSGIGVLPCHLFYN